jgi:hypothetical protein
VSKERARRRAEREAAREVAAAARARRERRRARWRALVRRLKPPDRRRAWLLARRSPGQRAATVAFLLLALGAIWYLVEPVPLRVGLTLLLILMLPVLVIVIFDRRM